MRESLSVQHPVPVPPLNAIQGCRLRVRMSEMKPAGVHHVAICVSDAQKGLAFYRDVLGMRQLPRPDLGPGYWLDAGGQQVHLMESDTQPLAANHFAIRVDDIDGAVTDLQEH